MTALPFGVLLATASFERAHTGLMLAATAAALGRPTVLFATQGGLHALCRDFSGLHDAAAQDAAFRQRGVAGFEELRETLLPMGTRLMACVSGMLAIGLDDAALIDGVERVGAPSFLLEVGAGQIVSP
ncbi:DsrE/DsrF/DrsH-like family protein [Acetobacteraceae bacterium KSS8]|uniref:DsrE/DsrF/DrsH-like family protein n=1 Tax=Endosaccharibacter trunci TaxID=2812733 RepID=A0ABT1WA62_9PROT|nr:DsrE/DsrF/DrsH-like family protein [Acetobacteraceae bacterium KSS8]